MFTKRKASDTDQLIRLHMQNSQHPSRSALECHKTTERKKVTNLQLISLGTSAHVYKGTYDCKTCIAKELAPIGLFARGIIYRVPSGQIAIRETPSAFLVWKKAEHRFVTAYELNRQLQDVRELSRNVLPVHSCLRQNGTLYSVSIGEPGTPLDRLEHISPESVILIGMHIAQMTAIINDLGWLLVDIKPSNYILNYVEGEPVIRLTDFDSAIQLRHLRKTKTFMCSNETASPEILIGNGSIAGTQSDVYSIAAMILNTFAKHSLTMDFNTLFDTRVAPSIKTWHSATINKLRHVLAFALQRDPLERMQSCKELAVGLGDICNMEGFSYEDLFL